MKPDEFVAHVGRTRASAILRTDREAAIAPAMEAAIRGGFSVVEFTLTIPHALSHVRAFATRGDVIVGAGTVLTVDDARAAVDAGARYLVSPVVDEAVIEEALRLGVVAMPGCHTPTELLRAHRAGAQLQKLFPAPAGGAAWVRATLAPMPFLRIVPTNGVDADNAAEFLRAGAHAIGFVGPLFTAEDLTGDRWDAIEDRARALLRAVAAV